MGRSEIVVIGAGGHAKVVIATARAAGFHVAAVFDNDKNKHGLIVSGVRVDGPISDVSSKMRGVIAIGDNKKRKEISESVQCEWVSIVHPTAIIDGSVRIDEGSVVFAGVIIQPDVKVGRHCILNTACHLDHDCEIGDFVHIAPGVVLAGSVKIGRGSLVGVGSSLLPGISVGDWATVGGGATVVCDVLDNSVVSGVPAKNHFQPR